MTAEIVNDDALEVIPGLGEFDYLITDPPYPIGGRCGHSNVSAIVQINEMMNTMAVSLTVQAIRAIKKSDGFCAWLMCDWRTVSLFSQMFQTLGMFTQSCIVWDKEQSAMSSLYHSQHELILFATTPAFKNRVKTKFLGKNIIAQKSIRRNKTHAFEKPPELVEQMCSAFKPGRVIDPFCGSGGLLVGAQRLGWDVVGIDSMSDVCDVARERLECRE